MATVSVARITRSVQPTRRLLTVADLAVFPSQLPSGPAKYELDNGELVIMPPPGDLHGSVQSKVVTELSIRGERKGLGKARGEVGVILWRDPDRVVGPDAAFIANRSLPIRLSAEGYLETIPDLVVEVVSKKDTAPVVQDKVKDYLKAGVRVVWVADPKTKTVTAYRRGRKPKVFKEDDTLTIEDVIPGFQMAVRQVFQE